MVDSPVAFDAGSYGDSASQEVSTEPPPPRGGSCAWGKASGGPFPLCVELEGPAAIVTRARAICEGVSTNEWSSSPCERGPAVIGGCATRGDDWTRTEWISPLYEPWRSDAYRAADLEERRAACVDGGGAWVTP